MNIETTIPMLPKIRYDPITTGYFKGAFAVQANLANVPAKPEEIVNVIFKGIKPAGDVLRRRIFRLNVEGHIDENTALSAETLCASLVEYGYQIHIIYDGLNWFRALKGASWVICKSERLEMPHGGNEVWYIPPEGRALSDPIVPIRPDTWMYLAAKGRDESEVLEFFSRSKYVWNML